MKEDGRLRPQDYLPLVEAALAEDVGSGDWTTLATVPETQRVEAVVRAKAPGVWAGGAIAAAVFERLSNDCRVTVRPDGTVLSHGDAALEIAGPARAVLAGERVALNFAQRLCGIATLTAAFVGAVAGTGVGISDTRKTTPTLRRLEKYAVRCGGGVNHRSALDSMLLVKENHIAAAGSLRAALEAAQRQAAARGLEVEIEVQTLEEFIAALELGPDWILLDHWSPESVSEAVRRRGARAVPRLEVSGNVTLERARSLAVPGIAVLSVGALTHSAPALDLSLLVTRRSS